MGITSAALIATIMQMIAAAVAAAAAAAANTVIVADPATIISYIMNVNTTTTQHLHTRMRSLYNNNIDVQVYYTTIYSIRMHCDNVSMGML